ncbi:MAG: WYL domain-containing protein [Solobacterium sp.]|nr:WYL domain-containing protein [Solobacterium sp.]
MAKKKTSAFILLEILKDETDENHILTRRELMETAKKKYGIEMNRRTFYSNIAILEDFDYDISKPAQNGKGYYLLGRSLEKSEVLLLCNAIHASHFISSRTSSELIRKLLKTQSRYERDAFYDGVYLPNRQKTSNQQLLLNIEVLSEAISEKKAVSFTYLTYDYTGTLKARRSEPYTLEPRYIVYHDGRGYMISTSPKYSGFSHYRLDRMKNVTILDQTVPELADSMDPYAYTRSKLFMFAGENIDAVLQCSGKILTQMMDVFGPETSVEKKEDDTFLISVSAPKQGILWLVQEYLDSVTICSPKTLIDEHTAILKAALERYQE